MRRSWAFRGQMWVLIGSELQAASGRLEKRGAAPTFEGKRGPSLLMHP